MGLLSGLGAGAAGQCQKWRREDTVFARPDGVLVRPRACVWDGEESAESGVIEMISAYGSELLSHCGVVWFERQTREIGPFNPGSGYRARLSALAG